MPVAGVKVVRNEPLKPLWATTDNETVRLYLGHVTDVLARLPERSVHMCVTSPPYWGLRSYLPGEHESKSLELGSEPSPDCLTSGQAQCGRCFVCNMVAVFRAVRRVLRDDGTVWLSLGDSYSGGSGGNGPVSPKQISNRGTQIPPKEGYKGLPSGNLVGVPWRVALALQADGWVLRSDVPWVKRSPMPESVRNRPAKALEYVFLFAKSMKYYYDRHAVARKATPAMSVTTGKSGSAGQALGRGIKPSGNGVPGSVRVTGDKRNWWNADLWFDSVDKPHGLTVVGDEIVGLDATTRGYEGSHFATFPPSLVEPCVLAGTSAHGCCADCGAPWKRVVESLGYTKAETTRKRGNAKTGGTGGEHDQGADINKTGGGTWPVKTVGWEPTCECGATEIVPCTVLDPFVGSGTTCCVAIEHGRRSVGIDLSETYLRAHAVPRVEGVLLARPALAHLAGKVRKAVYVGREV